MKDQSVHTLPRIALLGAMLCVISVAPQMVILSPSRIVILSPSRTVILSPSRTVILSPSRIVILSPSRTVILSEAKNLFPLRTGSAKNLHKCRGDASLRSA